MTDICYTAFEVNYRNLPKATHYNGERILLVYDGRRAIKIFLSERKSMEGKDLSAFDALGRLKEGNKIYINAAHGVGDISPERRLYTSKNGQKPYAVIVSCSDS